MEWLQRIGWFRRPLYAALAADLAQQAAVAVWDRIQPAVLDMSLAEARGYVRAKSTETLRAQARLPAALCPRARAAVLAEAGEIVVDRVIAEVRRIQLHRRNRRQAA